MQVLYALGFISLDGDQFFQHWGDTYGVFHPFARVGYIVQVALIFVEEPFAGSVKATPVILNDESSTGIDRVPRLHSGGRKK